MLALHGRMKLLSVHIRNFRNILDSTPFDVQPDVTCLIGKNESGKTTVLQALWLLNPHMDTHLDSQRHYPKWIEKQDSKSGYLNEVKPVSATFLFNEKELSELKKQFPKETAIPDRVTFSRNYKNELMVDFDVDRSSLNDVQDAELQILHSALADQVIKWLPKFVYFDDYHLLPGEIDVASLQKAMSFEDTSELTPSQKATIALLRMADISDDDLTSDDYEIRSGEMEAVANHLTQEVLKYWSQNQYLRMRIVVDKEIIKRADNQVDISSQLKLRVEDTRHYFTNSLDERSMGFRWFVSFLATFGGYNNTDSIIMLLDEPGHSLHGRAQADLIKFIDERIATHHQVIYSTNSPFMVDPNHIERTLFVEDKGPDKGAGVSVESMVMDPDTLYTLRNILGHDLVNNLFIAEHNLIVGEVSDYTYINIMSWHLKSLQRVGLDERWNILPIGKLSKALTFVVLLGASKHVTILLDSKSGYRGKLREEELTNHLSSSRIITPADIINKTEADIEDLFSQEDYLDLYGRVEEKEITVEQLPKEGTIIQKIQSLLDTHFYYHYMSDELLRNRDLILSELSEQTLDNFEKLFITINSTLGPPTESSQSTKIKPTANPTESSNTAEPDEQAIPDDTAKLNDTDDMLSTADAASADLVDLATAE